MKEIWCLLLVTCLITLTLCQAKDLFTINFIKNYIENEQKPTDLNLEFSGWQKHDILELLKQVSHMIVRFSSKSTSSIKHDMYTLFIADLCSTNTDIFMNLTKYFRSPYRWLVLGNNKVDDKILWNLPLLVDSDFVFATRNADVYTMTELYKPSPNWPTITNMRGYYNGTFVDTRERREMFRLRGNVMRHAVVMSNVIIESNTSKYHLIQEDRLKLEYDVIAKMSWRVVKLALEIINATASYVWSDTWLAMLNDLKRGRADLGTNCAMDVDRLDEATFTDCIVPVKTMFIFRQPPLSYVSNIYALPFSTDVWVAIVVCLIISIITIYMTSKLEAKNLESITQLDGKINDAVFFSLSAIIQMGCSLEPRKASGRILTFLLFTSMMALFAAYSANIVVLLQSPSTAVRTLGELVQSNMKLAALDTEYNRQTFKDAKDPVQREIVKKIMSKNEKDTFCNLNDCVKKLQQGLFVFHAILEPVYRRIEKTFTDPEKCDLMEIDFMKAFDQHTPINKRSAYIELFRVSFKRIREAGIRTALEKRYLTPKPKCMGDGTFSSVGIQNVKPVLYVFLFGVIASLSLMIIEIIVHKMTHASNTPQ